MTPILLAGDTVKGFLPDATSCVVTEERNGIFELSLTYPVAGPMFNELVIDRYIKAKPNDTKNPQLFRIYEVTKPIAGIVTVNCEHVSYALAHYPVTDVSLNGGTAAAAVGAVLAKVNSYLTLSHAFTAIETGWTATHSLNYKVGSARAALGGSAGSVLDTFGGEFEWDNYNVYLHEHRGSDTGVVVAYRKNMTDLKVTVSLENAYTALFPYAIKDDVLITVTGGKIAVTNNSGIADRVLIRDFSGEFQDGEEANATTLLAKANAFLSANNINAPSVNVTVSFVHLWQSPEYASLAALERVSLCDWVTVRHETLGVDIKAQVIKTEYDCIAERYNSIELGSARANFQDTLQKTVQDVTNLLKNVDFSAITAAYTQAIADATALITGADGGYVHLLPSGLSPQEIVISDVENYTLSTAKVWRWNKNGLGYSSTGYAGTYATAITADGKINASMITTGYLNAARITAGVLQSSNGDSSFDLDAGEVKTYHNYGSFTMAARMNSGRFQLMYNDNELGGLGTIRGGTPYLYFNKNKADELIIGYGDGYSTTNPIAMISVQKTKIQFRGENYSSGYIDDNGFNGRTNGTHYGNNYGHIYAPSGQSSIGFYIGTSNVMTLTNSSLGLANGVTLTGYSKTDHTHSGYAASNHSHASLEGSSSIGFYVGGVNVVTVGRSTVSLRSDVTLSGYSKTDHTHSGYAASNHTHNFSDIGGYRVSQYWYAGTSISNYRGYFYDSGDGVAFRTSSSSYKVFFTIGTTAVGYFDSSGYHATSSERIKEQITGCAPVLPLFRQSRIYSYTYKGAHKSAKRNYGFIVERETPEEVISESRDAIDLYSMAALNWKATQELLEKVERLEALYERR